MKKKSSYWLLALSFIVLIISLSLAFQFWHYIIYLPPLWERFTALPAATPALAYEKFQSELKKGNDKKALRYITRETRSRYQALLKDSEIREHYQVPLENLQEQYQTKCEDQKVCRFIAVYNYDYEVKEAYLEKIMGKDFLIPAGKRRLEITFVELKEGYWQINEL